ncbi:MAG: cache domain-containing protein, partial [Pseudomonadota bacterium]
MRLSFRQKVLLLATLPLILAAAAIAYVVADQSRRLAEAEIALFEAALIEAKRAELRNHVNIARTSFAPIYGRAEPDDEDAKLTIAQSLAAMTYGRDGSFFVYTFDGDNIVNPRDTGQIGKNWIDLTDPDGVPIVAGIIAEARTGDGFHRFRDAKPSTGQVAEKLVFAVPLSDWRWVIGTGVYIDDVVAQVAASRSEVEATIGRTFYQIAGLTVAALVIVFAGGLALNIHERRLADAKQKELTQRVIDAQEEERARVARELHDGISQLLVGVKFAVGLAARRATGAGETAIKRAEDGLESAINEVRRISRDLRPGVLDDLGLVPALEALSDDFARRTDIAMDADLIRSSRRFLPKEARTALYRVAQEALTNIERHSGAQRVELEMKVTPRHVVLRIADDGRGLPAEEERGPGIGLRNMAERVEQLGGEFRLTSRRSGLEILVKVPRAGLRDFDEEQ